MQKTSHFAHFPTYKYYYSIEKSHFTLFCDYYCKHWD